MREIYEKGKALLLSQGKRGISLLLCLVMLLSLVPAMSTEAEAKKTTDEEAAAPATSKYYALQVVTGTSAGDNVQYFAVHYLDGSGISRTELIYPNAGSLQKSYDIAKAAGTDNAQKKYNAMKSIGYASYLKEGVDTSKVKGLQIGKTDTYLFEPKFTFAKLTGIDILIRYDSSGNTKNSGWSCGGMEVYRVTNISGLDMLNYYGSDIMVNYSGEMLGRAVFNGAYETYSCSGKLDALYRLRTDAKEAGRRFEVYDAATSATKAYNTDTCMMIGIDIADVYGAGIEDMLFGTTVNKCKSAYECFVARFTYTDVNGATRNVDVPVLLSMLCYMNINGMGNKVIYDIAQQGEKLFAPVFAPGIDMSKKPTVTLYFGAKQASELCGLNELSSSGDQSVRVSGIQVYDEVGTITVKDYQIAVEDVGTPRWFKTADNYEGTNVIAGNMNKFSLEEYDATTSNLTAKDSSTTRYLVELITDTPKDAGTTSDVILDLTYETGSGNTRTVSTKVRDAINDYYGDWLTRVKPSTSTDDDADTDTDTDTNTNTVDSIQTVASWPKGQPSAYNIKMSAGQTAHFFVSANDVKQFKSAKISLGDGQTDDYQLIGLRIYSIYFRGYRTIQYALGGSDSYPSEWTIDRDTDYDNEPIVNFSGERLLVYAKNPQTIEFGKTAVTVVPTNDVDWSKFNVSMSYSDAMTEMGYTDIRTTYEVSVKVGSDTGELADNGDTGSENMFYFQITFADGRSSGYVLANQLIPSGRFRSGKTESFKIYMNYDYGDVKSVRLIPDDTIKEGESFDKLYVEKITVAKQSTTQNINKTWSCSVNEWIDIDYVDTGAQNTMSGQEGRKEGQLARTYSITSSSFITNFIMSVETASKKDGSTPAGYCDHMEGYMFAEISYLDKDGLSQSKTFDVYEAMRNYLDLESSGKSEKLPEKVGKLESGDGGGERINKNYMLRPGTTDQFMISVDGVASFNSITFYVSSPEYLCRWEFGPVAIYNITSGDGHVYINEFNQRVKSYELKDLTTSTEDYYVVDTTADGAAQMAYVGFNYAEVPVNKEECVWTSLIGREPDSKDDELNIYVYMKDDIDKNGNKGSPISSYNMSLLVGYNYTDSNGGYYTDGKNSVSKMSRSTDKNAFYTLGLSAFGLKDISGLKLQAMDLNNPNKNASSSISAFVDHIVIDRVRSGVVIDNYYYSFSSVQGNANGSAGPLIVTPYSHADSGTSTKEKQVVYLQLGAGTETFYPDSGETGGDLNDIAVALEYHSSNMIKSTDTVRTKNIFISDVCAGQKVGAGSIIKLTFTASNLDNVTGIQLAYMGNVKATVAGASIGVYDEEENDTWYGTTNSSLIQLTGNTVVTPVYSAASGGRIPATFTIKTADAEEGSNTSGCFDPIYTEIHYQDPSGSERIFSANDLNEYVTSGSFAAGQTATVRVLLPNCADLHYMKLEPKYSAAAHTAAATTAGDGTETVETSGVMQTSSWKIAAISVEIGEEGVTKNRIDRTINKTAYEGSPYIANLSNMTIAAKIKPASGEAISTIGEKKEILVSSGESVTITRYSGKDALISGSFKDVTVTAEQVVDNATKDVSNLLSTTLGRNSLGKNVVSEIKFATPSNSGSTVEKYRITIASQEIPDMKLEIEISVNPAG